MADITTGDLAAALGLLLRGDATRLITGAAVLEEAGPAHLAFVTSGKFFAAGELSAAGCLIAPPEFPASGDRAVLESAQPRAHFAQALGLLYPEPALIPGIHPSAVVHPSAIVDGSAEIAPYVRIGAGARIGPRTRIADGCSIGEETVIGSDCRLYPQVIICSRVTV